MASTKAAEKKQALPVNENLSLTVGSKTFVVKREDAICTALLLVLLLVVHSIRSKFLLIPFERDEGIYTYFGQLVLEGKTPYVDFIEAKFPGIFYFYGLMVKLFGYGVKEMHTGFMYLNLATIVLIYFASRKLFSPMAGLISAITYAFVSLTPNLSGFTVQSEHGVAFFTALGFLFYAFARNTSKWYLYALMGISMSAALMVKTNGVFLALWGGVIILTDFLLSKPRNLKGFLINGTAYTLGGILVVGILFFVVYAKGSFSDMIKWAYEHPKKYISGMPFEEGKKYFAYTRDQIVEHHKFFWIHAVLALLLCIPKPTDVRLKVLGFTVLIASFLTIVPGYFFYGHYWIQMVPGVALIAGLTYQSFISILGYFFRQTHPRYKYVYLGVFVVLTFSHVSAFKSYYYSPNYDTILRTVYGNNPFPESMEIAKFINANSKPEDGIVLIGSEPQIYVYTNKKCPSRFSYFTALVNNTEYHRDWQREFARDVEKAKPRYVVFFNHRLSLLVQPNTDDYVFQWANKFINDNYTLVGCVDMVDGYLNANYAWREQLATFKPQGQNVVYVYERKSN